MEGAYIVYVITDENGNITEVNSSAFLDDVTGWMQLDEGSGDHFHHAQGNYFDKPIITERGIWRYKIVNGIAVEKTPEEITAEELALPLPPPTADEKIVALETGNLAFAESLSGLQAENQMLAETVDVILTEVLPALLGS